MAERRLINPANWPYFDQSKMPYSLAAEKDGILFLSGQTAERENSETGKIECTGDAVEQMNVIMDKHKLLIEASGGKPEDMTNRTIFTSAAGAVLPCRTTRGSSARLQRSHRKCGEAISGRTMRREPGFTCRAI